MEKPLAKAAKKNCFVISPIGSEGSEVRSRADKVLRHIIRPPLESAGYNVVRADTIADPGMITSQIIEHVVSDDLVVADLTGHNPNVFYELAVRHAVGKPFIQMIDHKESIPFDIVGFRTVHFNHTDLDSAAQAKEEIEAQIKALEGPDFKLITPLNFTIDMKAFQASGDVEEVYISKMFDVLSGIQTQIAMLDRRMLKAERVDSHSRYDPLAEIEQEELYKILHSGHSPSQREKERIELERTLNKIDSDMKRRSIRVQGAQKRDKD